jgi:hypothetical protein
MVRKNMLTKQTEEERVVFIPEVRAMTEQTGPGERIGPEKSQPRMFGVPGPLEHIRLPWSWATEQLQEADTYWIATTRRDGRPHSRPVWGVWLDETFYFNTVRAFLNPEALL